MDQATNDADPNDAMTHEDIVIVGGEEPLIASEALAGSAAGYAGAASGAVPAGAAGGALTDDLAAYGGAPSVAYDTSAGAPAVGQTPLPSDATSGKPSAIRQDIQQTRSQMGSTLNAIEERLSPQRITEQAKSAVRDATIGRAEQVVNNVQDSARGAGNSIVETIKQNPLPAALIGLGLGWLVVEGRRNTQSNQRGGGYQGYSGYQREAYPGYPGYPGYAGYAAPYAAGYRGGNGSDGGQGGGQGVQGDSSSLQDKANQVGNQVANTASQMSGQVQNTASQVAGQVQDTAQQMGNQVQWQAQRAQGWFQQTLNENPLTLGAIALAGGIMAGLLIPETPQENQLMGPARDTLVQRAGDAAQDTVQRVQSVAQQAKNAAQNEAQNQGLVGSGSSNA